MKILVSWLADHVDLDGVELADLVETLAGLGLPVDDIVRTTGVAGVLTARVERTERPEGADTVQRVWITTGGGVEHHVWCGAFNFGPGDVVPYAPIGTTLPDGRVLGRRAILGVASEGMLCSARELALGDDHTGILVLPADSPLGVPYFDALGRREEVVLDLDVTRNRPDCWSHVGIARDVAAKLRRPFTPPRPPEPAAAGDEPRTTVELIAGDGCARFTSTVLSGVRVAPSAPWMAERLTAAGMRPINNVVDVSNYVMLELGQPNHPYDLATLGGRGFRVRRAGEGEALTTLDGVTRRLTTDDLLICDALDQPIGLAGIMGGEDTEIRGATRDVALEMAWFEPTGIAQSVVRTGLRSEASTRFERGVDPYGIDTCVARFVELLAETSPDVVVRHGAVDARSEHLPPPERSTTVRIAQVNRILGTALAVDDLAPLLDPIGFSVAGTGAAGREVAIPSWRPDCAEEIDVIEEVGRLYGYDRIGRRAPRSPHHGRLSATQRRRRLVRDVLLGLGISEVMPNPFLAPDVLARAGLGGDALRITNPLVADESVLRTSLRPGLLRAVAFNESHRRPGVALYEIGHVYPSGPGELPDEYEALGVVLAGQEAPAAVAVWRELAAALGVGARIDQTRVPPGLHPTRSATLVAGRDTIGAVGEAAPGVLDAFGIDERVAVLEVDLRTVLSREPAPALWKPTSRHPSSDLDLAFTVPDDVPAERVEKAVRQGAGALLVALELFDVYRGANVPGGHRSLAYRLRLQASDRTLTDADIAAVRERATAAAAKLGATLRG